MTAVAGGDTPYAGSVDLHAHSTASDGAVSPTAVVEAAGAAKLSALALTDHDTLAGVAEARTAGERFGVRIVAGVELSVMHEERELHMLGLHISQVDEMEKSLAVVRDTRRARAVEIVAKLNALGVPITADAVFAEAASGAVGRPHVARAMIAGGWARDFRDAFDRYLGAGRPANVAKERVTVEDGIRLVHEHGGLAIFAHPGQDGRRERIEALAALGLDGIEIRHPSQGAEDVARLTALTDFFGLVPSGGSDWHGTTGGPRVLGAMNVPAEWLARQDARLAARGSAAVA